MQTFLWHPLTPKCTWLSQNKSKKKLSENTGKTFSVIMPSFTCRGGGIFTEITVLRPPLRCLGLKKNIAKGAMERGGQKPNEGQHHHHQGRHHHHPVKLLQSCSRVVTKQGIRRTMLRRRLLTRRRRNCKMFRNLFCHLLGFAIFVSTALLLAEHHTTILD